MRFRAAHSFYDNNDRLTTDIYDSNGNTTSSAGISNTYDFENRMTGHGAINLVYDGDGNRVSETVGGTTTKYLVDDMSLSGIPQVLDELVNGSVTKTYAYGIDRISEYQQVGGIWTPSFYGYDGHGNARFLTNSAGSMTDTYDYDAFGMPVKTTGTTSNSFLYSSERYDGSVGLYDLRARFYSKASGRFWARDPVEGANCKPLTHNPYIYALDNPVTFIDPTGRAAANPPFGGQPGGSGATTGEYVTLLVQATLVVTGIMVLEHAIECALKSEGSGVGQAGQNAGNIVSLGLNISTCSADIETKPKKCKPCAPVVGMLGYRVDPNTRNTPQNCALQVQMGRPRPGWPVSSCTSWSYTDRASNGRRP